MQLGQKELPGLRRIVGLLVAASPVILSKFGYEYSDVELVPTQLAPLADIGVTLFGMLVWYVGEWKAKSPTFITKK